MVVRSKRSGPTILLRVTVENNTANAMTKFKAGLQCGKVCCYHLDV